MRRRNQGSETWNRLLNWDRDSAVAERLVGHILRNEGFTMIDPTHPLGGPDGGKDIVCRKDGLQWITGVYFPRRKKPSKAIVSKFKSDFGGVSRNNADAFIFATNQPLTTTQRTRMRESCDVRCEVYHLERLSSVLDSPGLYGVRLEFLDIEMTKDEQVAFFSNRDQMLGQIGKQLEKLSPLLEALESGDATKVGELSRSIPLEDLREFRAILESMTGWHSRILVPTGGHVQDLHVPLQELREFKDLLEQLSGRGLMRMVIQGPTVHDLKVPLEQLHEFKRILVSLVGDPTTGAIGLIGALRVPLGDIEKLEKAVDGVVQKLHSVRRRL